MNFKTFGLAIFLATLIAVPGHAQLVDVFPPLFKLQDADVQAISDAEDRILAHDPITAGTTEAWEGAGTGNSGTVSILKVFEKQGLSCLETAYDITVARVVDPIRYVIPWCKVDDGSWKMFF